MTLSFRDPDGRLSLAGERVLRIVNPTFESHIADFIQSEAFARLLADEMLVSTTSLGRIHHKDLPVELQQVAEDFQALLNADGTALILEHERIPFPSYPYEWAPEMLYAAGKLTLDLCERLLPVGLGLKDATPYNILFRGPQPVFIDLLSIDRREPRDPTWLPYAQFVRTFIRPLLVNKHFGLGLGEIFGVHRDGLYPSAVTRLCGSWQKVRPPFLSLVTLPILLGKIQRTRNAPIYREQTTGSPEKAAFILGRQFKSLRRKLTALRTRSARSSDWSGYMDEHHSEVYFAAKREFIERAIAQQRPVMVLDVGCNTGEFSAIAARNGARVVAIDQDPDVVSHVWRRAAAERLDILPLVVDLTRPTPAMGWRNAECPAFLERARGSFDCLLMLAVIHHMLVSERIPLDEILGLAAELTVDLLLIEYIPPDDPMFRLIARGNDYLYEFLTRECFENASKK